MRFFSRFVLAAMLVTAAVHASFAPSVLAQASTDEEARRHFRLGQAHYENGSFAEAATEFEQAYELSQRPQLLYNVYVAYRDAGDLVRSRDALREYLERVPDAENGAMLRARLESLDRMIEQGLASEPATTPDATSPDATEADPDAARDTTAPEPTPDADAAPDATARDTTPTTTPDGGGGLSPLPFVVAGAGAALMIGGAVTGALAMSSQDTLDSTCPDRACPPGYDFQSEADNGRALAITTDVLLVTGGVALAAGIVWLVVDLASGGSSEPADDADQPTVTAACGPDGCAVAARFAL